MSEVMDFEVDFAKVVRYLMTHTFIVKEKRPNLYKYCREIKNQKKINAFLSQIGYYVEVKEALGYVQMLDTADAKNEMESGRNENLYKFTETEKFLLAVFWQYYAEHTAETEIVISAKTLRERLITCANARYRRDISEPLKTLKYFNLIDFKDPTKDDFAIVIYSTILSIFDANKFKEIVNNKEDPQLKEGNNDMEVEG